MAEDDSADGLKTGELSAVIREIRERVRASSARTRERMRPPEKMFQRIGRPTFHVTLFPDPRSLALSASTPRNPASEKLG